MRLTAALFFTAALCLGSGSGAALAADETQIFQLQLTFPRSIGGRRTV